MGKSARANVAAFFLGRRVSANRVVRRIHIPVTSASGIRVMRSGLVCLKKSLILRAISTVLGKDIGPIPRRDLVQRRARLHPTPGVFGRAYHVS